MKRAFDYVLFDLGNTLLYYDAPWPGSLMEAIEALSARLISFNIPIDEKIFQHDFHARLKQYYVDRDVDCVEFSTTDVLRNLLNEHGVKDISTGQLRSALDAMYIVSQSYWNVEADAIAVLEYLKNSGYSMGLISNAGDSNDVQVLVDKAGIRKFLEVIVISANVGLRKPHSRIFETALRFWGAVPGQAVMVGDLLPADILGANQLGIASIWITRRASKSANQPYLESIVPDASIATLSELPTVLENWKSNRVG